MRVIEFTCTNEFEDSEIELSSGWVKVHESEGAHSTEADGGEGTERNVHRHIVAIKSCDTVGGEFAHTLHVVTHVILSSDMYLKTRADRSHEIYPECSVLTEVAAGTGTREHSVPKSIAAQDHHTVTLAECTHRVVIIRIIAQTVLVETCRECVDEE